MPRTGTVPLLQDADGRPLKRNFVHVDDLVSAILAAIDNPRAKRQLFNICMDRPVDYGEVADYLARTRGLDSIDIPSQFHSNWMDNSKAKYLLGWQPEYDLEKLDRLGLGIRTRAKTILASSGIRVDVVWRARPCPSVYQGRNTNEETIYCLPQPRRWRSAPSQAMSQEKKQLVIVVKGLDNPFFEAINQGCQKWNSENASSEYECFYTGPASTSDEAGEAQIVAGHARQGRSPWRSRSRRPTPS